MEVEISRESFNCSRYWPVALVADNSHVVLLDVPERAKGGAQQSPYHVSCHKPFAAAKPELHNNRNEMHDGHQSTEVLLAKAVRMKGRFDNKFKMIARRSQRQRDSMIVVAN